MRYEDALVEFSQLLAVAAQAMKNLADGAMDSDDRYRNEVLEIAKRLLEISVALNCQTSR